MLNLFFMQKLNPEQDEQLFDELKGHVKQYEHDIGGIDMKVTVYVAHDDEAMRIVQRLKSLKFDFDYQIFEAKPLFHDEFVQVDDEIVCLPMSHAEAEAAQAQRQEELAQEERCAAAPPLPSASNSEVMEQKPLRMGAGIDEGVIYHNIDSSRSPSPEPRKPIVAPNLAQNLPPLAPFSQQYVTPRELEQIQKAQQAMQATLNEMSRKLDNVHSAPTTPMAPFTHSTSHSIRNAARSMDQAYQAKNELIANGIRCEYCMENIKGIEPVTRLIEAVREHVMGHFDRDCPRLKRFECAVCNPPVTTNFVDEFEKHLRKHGGSLPEARNKCTKNLLTKTHLKIICDLANKCFPEVFEKKPPEMNTIKAIEVPSKAKSSVFPPLDNLFCQKYKIPVICRGRASLPITLVNLN